MKVLCLGQSPEVLILEKLFSLSENSPEIVEVNQKKMPAQQDLTFGVWPILTIDNKPTYFGIRSIIKYVFTKSKFLPLGSLPAFDSQVCLADSIFASAVPEIVRKFDILVENQVVEEGHKKLRELIEIGQSLFTKDETIGSIYLRTMISIVASFGVGVEPLPSEKMQVDGLSDYVLTYAKRNLGIEERYTMSKPTEKMMYLSTPIYYVNGVPHIGHVFTTTLVDTLARWWKLRQIPCIWSTGTDEHGMKVQTTAAEHGVDPQTWCDQTTGAFRRAWDDYDIHPDAFIRTTDKKHMEVATKLWTILADKGYIYKGTYQGWYSKREECFIPENQIVQKEVDGVVKHFNTEDGSELEWSSEANYLFKLSEMGPHLLQWMDANPTCITPKCYYNQVRGLINAGLNDLSVSRERVSWGVPVPGDEKQTMYVWIDALANYLTVAGWDGENDGIWPADMHVVGKDIIKFHGVYWPAFLLAAGIKPYKRLCVHGWWTNNEEKMSKSLGNTLDPKKLKEFWGLEPVKYYLLREATLVTDSDYSATAMLARYNNDLADVFGNLIMRVINPKLIPNMEIPECGELTDVEKKIIESVEVLPGTVDRHIMFGRTRAALTSIWDVIRDINKYITCQEPWKLEKGGDRLRTVMYTACEALRIILLCIYPFLPQTAVGVLKELGAPEIADNDKETMFKFGLLKPGTKMTTAECRFPKKVLPKAE